MRANEFPDLTGVDEEYSRLARGTIANMMNLSHRNSLLHHVVDSMNADLNERARLINSHTIHVDDRGIIIHNIVRDGVRIIAAEGRPGIDEINGASLAFVGRLQRVDNRSR